ncbi:hypothetical protein Pcinc_014043 [Petrolisthes cinctipes]|uniref:ATP-dependent DNA helicase n=1 Tax=Petrolisthes cinctipes TaxID=88211 RepID=A0AAE1KPM8_PETCI|nr:hypothetical protein Pcinc_014043 [Petrolisthes cinctipes]
MDDCEVVSIKDNCQDPESTLKQVEIDIRKVTQELQILEGRKVKLVARREKLKDAIQQQKSAKLAKKDWDRQDFSWSKELENIQKTVFKVDKLRAHQLPTMNATMSGVDAILIMPTGGGKSLCFQLPALVSKGITLVVTPLVSLMEDQLMGLRNRGVQAAMLSANSTRDEVNTVHNDMTNANSRLKLVYVTPEKLAKSKRFMSKLQKMHQMGRFARLAIDEVHCCSQWGHDFRPDYKFLGIIRKMFPGTPILGLTATATSRVIQDVQKILNISGCLILKASFNRPNLFYEVRLKPQSQEECVTQLQHMLEGEFRGKSGIIYTMTIKDAEELVSELRKQGLRVAPYHAQLPAEIRSKVHRRWVENEYQAVVATIAFGMGIDKPDVRYVIHHCISKSMENFYQESGRAGRDGEKAQCIVFWKFADLTRQSTMVFTEQTGLENLYGLVSYCLDGVRCRRNIIADHFDERWESSDCGKMCDHCRTPQEHETVDLTTYGEQLLMILGKSASMDQRLTGQKLIDLFMGKGTPKLRVQEAIAKGLRRDRAESIVAFFLIDGFLREDFHFTPYNTISYILPGPKAEAGLAPSNMTIGRVKKLPELEFNSSNECKDNKKTNVDPSTKKRKVDDMLKIKKADKNTKSSMAKGSNGRLSSREDSKVEVNHKVTNNESPKITKTRTTSSKSMLQDSKCDDSESDSDLAGPSKRKRVITIEDSSDASDI